MSLKSKKFRFSWVVLLVSIVLAFSGNVLHAQEQSPNSTVTIKLKVISESMDASDINEIRRLIEAGADVNVINKNNSTPLCVASEHGHISAPICGHTRDLHTSDNHCKKQG